MLADSLLPLLSTLISATFALLLAVQFAWRRKPYQLIWAFSLAFYAIGVFAEYQARRAGWSGPLYRAFYLFGGLYVAAYLGMGTVFLLCPPRLARTLLLWLVLASCYGALRALSAPLDLSLLPANGEPGGVRIMPQDVRVVAIVLNTFGTVALIGGALASAHGYWRGHGPARRIWSNLLIAAGALVAASGSTLLALGLPAPFSLAKLLGVALILAGFLLTLRTVAAVPRRTGTPAAALPTTSPPRGYDAPGTR
jgi:hypothetical protein